MRSQFRIQLFLVLEVSRLEYEHVGGAILSSVSFVGGGSVLHYVNQIIYFFAFHLTTLQLFMFISK